MKKYVRIIAVLTVCIFGFAAFAKAQTYEEELKKMQEQQEKEMKQMQTDYEDFIKKEREAFDNYIKQADHEFSNYLKGQWDAFAVLKGQKQAPIPGPVAMPTFDPKIPKKDVKTFTVSKTEVDMAPRQNQTLGIPVLPDEQALNEKNFPANTVSFSFYGANVRIEYDQNLSQQVSGSINEKSISGYWDEACKAKYFPLLDQLLKYKTEMNLNDWGYYLLVKKTAGEIAQSSKNATSLLTWFLMIKSSYKVKIGYTDNNVYLMLPSNSTMYAMPYFTFNGLAYYVPDLKGEQIYTYKKDFPDARLIIDLNLTNPANLGNKTAERNVNFKYEGKEYKLKFKYNRDLIDFYNDYPQCELGVYFNGSISRIAKESLVENLKPIIQGKSQLDAINILLAFIQLGFEYKTDQEQFSKEKFNFPEETLHYPFCDCEDRSIFLSFLVKELLGQDVIGLNFPDHVACAVNFKDAVEGDSYAYKDKKYVIADPTYINAPAGMTMPMYMSVKPTIVEIDNLQNKEQLKRQVWEKLYASGGNRGDNGQDIVFDDNGNSYVTGYFSGEAKFGNFKLTTGKETKDIFIAKLDKKSNFLWAKQAQGKGNEIAYGIALDKSGNAIITGSFDNAVSFDQKTLKSSGKPDVFVSKYDKNGQLLWASKVGFDTISDLLPSKIYMARFNSQGKLLTKKFFNETEYFDKYGIIIDSTGTANVTGSFSTALSMVPTSKDATVTNTAAAVDFAESWRMTSSKLLESNYSPEVAGLFAFIQSIRLAGAKVEGKAIQEAIDKSSPDFKNASPKVYKNLGEMTLIKNSSGIVSINTGTSDAVTISTLKIENNSKVKFVTYEDGNSRINVLNGISFNKGIIKYDLNFIKIFKDNGDLLLDYDADNTQKRINMKKDIME
ncbi:MAG: SBBP repeat-containing protein [Bacteroidia bacterium]|nr:SBBP repeat-containing protein [Bacteroidia bacterium]